MTLTHQTHRIKYNSCLSQLCDIFCNSSYHTATLRSYIIYSLKDIYLYCEKTAFVLHMGKCREEILIVSQKLQGSFSHAYTSQCMSKISVTCNMYMWVLLILLINVFDCNRFPFLGFLSAFITVSFVTIIWHSFYWLRHHLQERQRPHPHTVCMQCVALRQ